MKLLHTADWHVGKVLKGHARLDEHRAVLAEIVAIAEREQVDAVLVCGDVFESAAPSPEAQAVVWQILLALRATGAEVFVIAGNHDSGAHLDAVAPLAAAAGCHAVGVPRRPDEGGVVERRARSDGSLLRVALLPFVSQRGIVRSIGLMAPEATAATHAQAYADRLTTLVGALTTGFTADAVNVVAAHVHVRGGMLGGGERDAQSIFDYWVDASAFPVHAHYVALGHLHRTQQLAGRPVWYSGSPIRVDFGEQDEAPVVLLVEAAPATPAKVRPVTLTAARRLRTLRGSEEELAALRGTTGDDLLRLVVQGRTRSGLADDLREVFPLALEVRVEAPDADHRAGPSAERGVERRTPGHLFHEFLADRNVDDPRLERLFAELLDDATSAGAVQP